MQESLSNLTFKDLRKANIDRLPQFKNAKGEHIHLPDGSDWSYSDWCMAAMGELGELGNLLKKLKRGDFTLQEVKQDLADEIADAHTYIDILAFRLGIDSGEAIINKFNVVSERVGATTRLGNDGVVCISLDDE